MSTLRLGGFTRAAILAADDALRGSGGGRRSARWRLTGGGPVPPPALPLGFDAVVPLLPAPLRVKPGFAVGELLPLVLFPLLLLVLFPLLVLVTVAFP